MLHDRIKNWHYGIVKRAYPRGMVFHHVPKCGGTSVGLAIRRRFLLSQATIIANASFRAVEATIDDKGPMSVLDAARSFRERMLLYHLYNGVRCVSAHVRFSPLAYDLFSEQYGFVTILRDPVQRYLSHYFMSFGREGHLGIEVSLEQFIDTPLGNAYGAVYCDYYAGYPEGVDFTTSDAVDRAVDNLSKFAAVGFLDNMPAFRDQIGREFGFRPRIGHENRATHDRRDAARSVPESTLLRIQEICAPDIAVYSRARRALCP